MWHSKVAVKGGTLSLVLKIGLLGGVWMGLGWFEVFVSEKTLNVYVFGGKFKVRE